MALRGSGFEGQGLRWQLVGAGFALGGRRFVFRARGLDLLGQGRGLFPRHTFFLVQRDQLGVRSFQLRVRGYLLQGRNDFLIPQRNLLISARVQLGVRGDF